MSSPSSQMSKTMYSLAPRMMKGKVRANAMIQARSNMQSWAVTSQSAERLWPVVTQKPNLTVTGSPL